MTKTPRVVVGREEGLLGNLASTYQSLGRSEQALQLKRGVYSGNLKLKGEEHRDTLQAANNYATSLVILKRFEEAKSVLRKTIPIARRLVGEDHELYLGMRMNYGRVLCHWQCQDTGPTLDDLREAVTTLEDARRIARRVFGGAHPLTEQIEWVLPAARASLRAREES